MTDSTRITGTLVSEIVVIFTRNDYGTIFGVTDDQLIQRRDVASFDPSDTPSDIPAWAATWQWGQRTVLVTENGLRFLAEDWRSHVSEFGFPKSTDPLGIFQNPASGTDDLRIIKFDDKYINEIKLPEERINSRDPFAQDSPNRSELYDLPSLPPRSDTFPHTKNRGHDVPSYPQDKSYRQN